MKVLQINSVCGVGSTGRIATDLHRILEEQGHESYIAYGRGEARNCENAIKIGNKIDTYIHVTQTRLFDRHGLGSYLATKKFIKQIEELNPDVIHLHNIHGYYINMKVLFEYLKRTNKPVVWTLHDCWPFTGHCAYFDYVGCERWKSECKDCPQKNGYPSSLIKSNTKNNYQLKKELFSDIKNLTIVTPSKWLADNLKNSFLKEYPVQVINNGIDLETFKIRENKFKEKYKLQNKIMLLGVASIWDKRKGMEYFLEIANQITKDKVIVLVGVTEKQKSKLPDNIIGITKTNNIDELAEIYTAADIFINPTLEDNFPTTNLEALACGTPVITFNTGGSIESVDDTCGVISKKDELIKWINTLSERNLANMSKNCIRRATTLYSKDEKWMEYIQLYNKMRKQ